MDVPDKLCIAHVNSETGYSGGEVQVFLLLEGLRKLGHRVVLFCQPGSRSEEEACRHGIEHQVLRMRTGLDVPSIVKLSYALPACRANLVHLHTGRVNWLGGLAAYAAHVPAISTRRMDRRVKRNWRTRLLYRHLVEEVVAISPAVAECLTNGGVPTERTRVIWDAVDPARFRPAVGRDQTRASLDATAPQQVVLALAALIPRKGIDLLLEALALLRREGLHPIVWIAGDGPERAALEAQSTRLGLNPQVRFLGERRDVADLLSACDLFVLPSRREGMGVAALEAMAASRPVVASAVGGLQHAVVDGGTGVLFPPGDVPALARALTRLLQDDEFRRRAGQAGPSRIAKGFLAEQMVDAYEQVYRQVVRSWRQRSL